MKVARSAGRMRTPGRRPRPVHQVLPAVDVHPAQPGRCAGRGNLARSAVFVAGIVDHHDVLEGGDPVDDRRHPGEQTGRDDEDARPRVGELVRQVVALVGGVDRHGDPTAADRARPRQERAGRVLDERRHPVVLLGPELRQRATEPARGLHHVHAPRASRHQCRGIRRQGLRPTRRSNRSRMVDCSSLVQMWSATRVSPVGSEPDDGGRILYVTERERTSGGP